MKYEFGAWTSFLSLCFLDSVAGRGFNRSCARTCHVSMLGIKERRRDTMMTYLVAMWCSDSDCNSRFHYV